jgi:hypothetical protein
MERLSKAGARSEGIRERAADLGPGGPADIRAWIVQRFKFVRDPVGVELLKSPAYMVGEWERTGRITGDCDDAAILGASIALASGYRVRWVLLGFAPAAPFKHIFAEASPTGRAPWTDFDVTKPAQFPPGLKAHRRLVIAVR